MIEETLEDLLHEHEMVVVPGLGAFLTQAAPAEVNFGNHQVLPPSKSIVFNAKVLSGGSKLTEALAQTLGTSQEHARQSIENYIEVLKEQLAVGGRAWVGRLGELSISSDGTIQFQANPSLNLLSDSFGLAPLEVVPVALQIRKQTERKGFVVPIDPVYSGKASRRNGAKVRQMATRLLPIAASFTGILIAGAAIYWLNTGRAHVEMASFNVLTPESQVEAPMEQPSIEPAASQPENNILSTEKGGTTENPVEADIESAPVESIEKEAEVATMSYFVVAGSFSKEENLLKMKDLLASKGFESIELEEKTPAGATRVAAAGFASKEEAKQFIAEKQSDFQEQLWVYSK